MADTPGGMPSQRKGEAALAAAKAAASIVPIVGGPVAELLDYVLRPAVDRRRDEWLEDVAGHLADLEEQLDGFSVDALAENELFISAILEASTTALKTQDAHKREALCNAVLSAAVAPDLDEAETTLYLSWIDQLTPWHLRLLSFLDDKEATRERENRPPFPDYYMGGVGSVLEHVYPELVGRRDFYDLVVSDLNSRGLVTINSLHMTGTTDGYMLASQSSPLGKRFIEFVSAPLVAGN